jgi:hypothetical protein
MLRRGTALVLAVGALAGCADIRMTTVDTQERVLGRTQRVVPGAGVRVRARLDDTTLVLQTMRGCELVDWERVEILEVREPDEELVEEGVLLGLAAIPLGVGVGLLVDAPNVYDDDRNSPQYNSTGQTGAYVAGTVLTSIGGLIALGPIVQLFRIAGAGEETVSTTERRGEVKSANVPCQGASEPIRTSVVLEVGGHRLMTPGTDAEGHLEIDLAKVIPPEIAERAVTVKVIVSGKVVGELDVQPILDEQRRRGLESEQATPFSRPSVAPTGPDAPVIASEPEELDEKTRGAIDKAREAKARACRGECERGCADDARGPRHPVTLRCVETCEEACR